MHTIQKDVESRDAAVHVSDGHVVHVAAEARWRVCEPLFGSGTMYV